MRLNQQTQQEAMWFPFKVKSNLWKLICRLHKYCSCIKVLAYGAVTPWIPAWKKIHSFENSSLWMISQTSLEILTYGREHSPNVVFSFRTTSGEDLWSLCVGWDSTHTLSEIKNIWGHILNDCRPYVQPLSSSYSPMKPRPEGHVHRDHM